MRNGLLLGASLGVCLGLAEATVRVFGIGPLIQTVWHGNFRFSDNPVLRYELEPLSPDGEFRINAAGMRDREYPVRKPDHTFRIAVLGDSIAYGHGVPQDQVFSAQLEALLGAYYADAGVRFEVLNFAVTGYGFAQVVETLRSRVLDFDPDLAIYAYCLNDPQEYSLELAGLESERTRARERYARVWAEGARHLLERSHLYVWLRYRYEAWRRPARPPDPGRDDPQFAALHAGRLADYLAGLHRSEATWGPVEAGLSGLAALGRRHDLPIHVAIVPLLEDLESYPLVPVHEQLAAAFAANSMPVLDLLGAYALFEERRGHQIGLEPLHPSSEGHAFTAVALLRHLLVSGALPGLGARDFDRMLRGRRPESAFARIAQQAARA